MNEIDNGGFVLAFSVSVLNEMSLVNCVPYLLSCFTYIVPYVLSCFTYLILDMLNLYNKQPPLMESYYSVFFDKWYKPLGSINLR